MMFKKTLLAAAVVAFGGLSMTTSAATSTTFDVKINILASCSIGAATTPIDFGGVQADTPAGDVALTKSTTLSMTCSKTTPYAIGLTTPAGTDTGTGVMTGQDAGNTGDSVDYTLYQPDADGAITTAVWGGNSIDPANPGNDYASVGTGTVQSINVYATVTNPNHTPGNYLDTVTVNVYF